MPDPKTNSTAPEGCAPLPGSEGALRINFGIYRRSGRRTENRCGKLTIAGTWEDDQTHQAIRAKIRNLNPGWDVQGYCLSDPQNANPVPQGAPDHE